MPRRWQGCADAETVAGLCGCQDGGKAVRLSRRRDPRVRQGPSGWLAERGGRRWHRTNLPPLFVEGLPRARRFHLLPVLLLNSLALLLLPQRVALTHALLLLILVEPHLLEVLVSQLSPVLVLTVGVRLRDAPLPLIICSPSALL